MTAKTIRELTRYLPVDGPYPNATCSVRGPTERSFRELCLAVCLNDPEFGYNFVMAFVNNGRTIPPGVLDINLRRAFYYFTRNSSDDVMCEAYALVHPANTAKRRILNALLICQDTNLTQIAEVLSLPENVVGVYEQLWFNVRDRIGEKSYIAFLVFPQTRFESTEQEPGDEQDYAQALLRAGHNFGSQEVLYMAGLTATRNSIDRVAGSSGEFESILMGDALTRVRHGGANAKIAPAIDRAKTLVAASKRMGEPERTGDEIAGLGGISASRSVLENVLNIQQPDIRRRLGHQQSQQEAPLAARKAGAVHPPGA